MTTARGGNWDAFGMTLDAGWDCTGDALEFLRTMDRIKRKLGRVPTPLEGFRAALAAGWAKGPPDAPRPPPVVKDGRVRRLDVPTDPAELSRALLSILASAKSRSTSEIIDKFKGGGRGGSEVYRRTRDVVEPALRALESTGLITRVTSRYLRHGARWKLIKTETTSSSSSSSTPPDSSTSTV